MVIVVVIVVLFTVCGKMRWAGGCRESAKGLDKGFGFFGVFAAEGFGNFLCFLGVLFSVVDGKQCASKEVACGIVVPP
jgi:hypothetical protein